MFCRSSHALLHSLLVKNPSAAAQETSSGGNVGFLPALSFQKALGQKAAASGKEEKQKHVSLLSCGRIGFKIVFVGLIPIQNNRKDVNLNISISPTGS